MSDVPNRARTVTQSPRLRYGTPLVRRLFVLGFSLAEFALLMAAILVWQTPAAQSLASDVAQAAETMVEATRDPNPSRPTGPTGVRTPTQSPLSSSIATPVSETIPAILAPDQANEMLVSSGPILLAETLEKIGLLPTRASATSSTDVTSVLPPLTDEPANPKIATDLGIAATGWQTITTQGFEGTTLPDKWYAWDDNGATNGNLYWGPTTARSYAGNRSIWAAEDGPNGRNASSGDQYTNYMNSWIRYGPFDLSNATQAELQFRLWSKTELTYDKVHWFASGNGTNWDGQALSGNTGGWTIQTLNLASANGKNFLGDASVWIGFKFESDGSITDVGAFIDEIVLRKYVQDPTGNLTITVNNAPSGAADVPNTSTRVGLQNLSTGTFVGGRNLTPTGTRQAQTTFSNIPTGTHLFRTLHDGPRGTETWGDSDQFPVNPGSNSQSFARQWPIATNIELYSASGTRLLNGTDILKNERIDVYVDLKNPSGSTTWSSVRAKVIGDRDRNGSDVTGYSQYITLTPYETETVRLSFYANDLGHHSVTLEVLYSDLLSDGWAWFDSYDVVAPPNNPPTVSNPSITPSSGGPNTDFVFEITYTDADNDLPNPRQVFVGTNTYDMTEVDSGDTHVRDGKRYRLTTRLPIGSYNTTFRFNDGVIGHSDATSYHPGIPIVENRPPGKPTGPNPAQNATGINPVGPTLSWSASDPDDNPLRYRIYLGTDGANLPKVGEQDTLTSFVVPQTLFFDTWYTWRIDTWDGTNPWVTGDNWVFQTQSPPPPQLSNPTVTLVAGTVPQGLSATVNYQVGIMTSGAGALSVKVYDPSGVLIGSKCDPVPASMSFNSSIGLATTNATPQTTYPIHAELIFRRGASTNPCPLTPISDNNTAVWMSPGPISHLSVYSPQGFWFEQLPNFDGTWTNQEKESFARTVSLEAAATDYLVKTASIAWGLPDYDALVQQTQTGQIGAPYVRRAFPLVIKNIASRGERVVIETDAGFTVRAISIGDSAIQGNEINVGSSETLRIVVHLEPPLGLEAGQSIPFRFRARLKDSQIVLATSDEKRISFVPLTQYLAGAYNCTTSFFVDGATSIVNLVTDTGKFALDSAYYYGPSSLVTYAYDPDGYLSGVTQYNTNIATFFGGIADQVTSDPIRFGEAVLDAIILENVRTAYDDSASGCNRAKAVGSIGVDVGLIFVGEGVAGKVSQVTSRLAARGFVVKNIVTHGDDFLKITVATKADDGITVVKSLNELLELDQLPKVTKEIVADPRVTARLAAAPAKVQWTFFEDVASSRAVKLLSTAGDDAAIDAYLRILERELSHPIGSGFERSLRTAAAKLVPESGPAALSADEFSQFVRAVDYFQAERVTGIDKALRLVGQQGGDGTDAALKAKALSRAKRVVDGTRQNPLSIEHDVSSLTDIDLVSVDSATSRFYFTEIKSGGRLDVVRDSTTGRYRLKADLDEQLQKYDRIRNDVDLRRQARLIENVPPDNIYLRLTADPATIVVPNVDDPAERLRILREVLRRDYGMTTEFVPSIWIGKDAQAEDQGTLLVFGLYETRLSPAHVLTNDGQSPYPSATQQLTLTGLVDPRATSVRVNGETVSPTAQADGSKSWSYPTTLWHGENEFVLVASAPNLTTSEPVNFVVTWDIGALPAPTITTNGGNDFVTDTSPVALEGTVPPRIYETIQVNGSTNPITSYDADTGAWRANVALTNGPNVVSLTGVTRAGDISPADSITITLDTPTAVLPTVTSIEYLNDEYQEPGWLTVRLRGTKQVGDTLLVNGQVPNNLTDAGTTWTLETSINVGAWLLFTDDPNRFEFTARRGSTTSAATTVRFPYSSTLSGSATPGGGMFTGPTSVALSSTATITVTSTIDGTAGPSRVYTPSAKAMHYTTDGSLPTPASPTYTTPIAISQTTTLRVLAVHPARLGDHQFQEIYTITPTDTGALDEPSFETVEVWQSRANGFQVCQSNLWASEGSQSMRIDNPGTTQTGWFGEFWQQVDLTNIGVITFDAKGYFGDNDLELWVGDTRLWQSDGVDHQWTHHTVTVPIPSDLASLQTLKFRYAVRVPGNGNIWSAVDNLRLTQVQTLTMTISDGSTRIETRDWTKAFVKLYRVSTGELVSEGHASALGDGAKGTIAFAGLEPGSYTADVFYEDTTWGPRGEHWGNPLDIVVGTEPTTYQFIRHEPYVTNLTVRNLTTGQSYTQLPAEVTLGDSLELSVTVTNGKTISGPGTAIEFLLDDGVSLVEFPRTDPVDISPNGTHTFRLIYTPDRIGQFRRGIRTFSRWPTQELTDWLDWSTAPSPLLNVIAPIQRGQVSLSVVDPTGRARSRDWSQLVVRLLDQSTGQEVARGTGRGATVGPDGVTVMLTNVPTGTYQAEFNYGLSGVGPQVLPGPAGEELWGRLPNVVVDTGPLRTYRFTRTTPWTTGVAYHYLGQPIFHNGPGPMTVGVGTPIELVISPNAATTSLGVEILLYKDGGATPIATLTNTTGTTVTFRPTETGTYTYRVRLKEAGRLTDTWSATTAPFLRAVEIIEG